MVLSIIGSNTTFLSQIEDLVWSLDISYIEAVMEYCKRYNAEEEAVGNLVKKEPYILMKIENEAMNLRLLKEKQGARLPL